MFPNTSIPKSTWTILTARRRDGPRLSPFVLPRWTALESNLWSIKFIGNSRDKAGHWESNVYKLTPIMTRIKSQMQLANNFFQTLALHQSENGGHNYHLGLTAATHCNLVLDNSCPWIEENIGNSDKFSFIAKQMLIPALPICDVHLSGPVTVGYHLQQMIGDERRMVEILLMAGYASGCQIDGFGHGAVSVACK